MDSVTVASKRLSPGRPLGKNNLSDEIKLDILKQKKLHQITQREIASQYGIARRTVNVLTEDHLSLEAKLQLDTYVKRLERTRDKTLIRIEEKIDKDEFRTNEYGALYTSLNTGLRLEKGQSTVNIAVSNHAQILHNWISTNQPNTQEIEQAIEATSDNNGYSAQELRDCLANIAQEKTENP